MERVTIAPFPILGISRHTTNEGAKAVEDIVALWTQWGEQQLTAQIPNLVSPAFYCVYTHYQGDHTAPYDVILGHRVEHLESIPEGCVGHTVVGGQAAKYTAQAPDLDQAVGKTWREIWASQDLDRAYQSDYEVYALDFSEASVLVGIKEA